MVVVGFPIAQYSLLLKGQEAKDSSQVELELKTRFVWLWTFKANKDTRQFAFINAAAKLFHAL